MGIMRNQTSLSIGSRSQRGLPGRVALQLRFESIGIYQMKCEGRIVITICSKIWR
jgi:hypothetical protein